FDDVMNDQRKVIYEQRKELMQADDVSATVSDMRYETIMNMVSRCIPERAYAEQWNVQGLHEEVLRVLSLDLPIAEWAGEEGIADEEIRERILQAANRLMAEKTANYTPDIMRMAEKSLLLQLLDQTWKDHLLSLDHLRQGIGLRAYGQKDPLNEYKREAFNMFDTMLDELRETTTTVMSHLELQFDTAEDIAFDREQGEMHETRNDPAYRDDHAAAGIHPAALALSGVGAGTAQGEIPPGWVFNDALARHLDPEDSETWGKVPRNAPCPCATGKKYKHCHGRVD
ncbi:MAG: SEC-C domain-containing protein, partial [Rhodospirillales bacterium]|nr:SEC-C domain-containing protein [Rhodospirillales bacterium]